MILSPNEAAWLAQQVFPGDPTNATIMVAVGIAESGLNTDQLSRSTTGANIGNRDHGWMQISNRWNGGRLQELSDWRDPLINARLARLVWNETKVSGKDPWTAWHVYTSPTTGTFYQYMPDAKIAMLFPFAPSGHALTIADMTEFTNELIAVGRDVEAVRQHFA